jgi:hypothetical protein
VLTESEVVTVSEELLMSVLSVADNEELQSFQVLEVLVALHPESVLLQEGLCSRQDSVVSRAEEGVGTGWVPRVAVIVCVQLVEFSYLLSTRFG